MKLTVLDQSVISKEDSAGFERGFVAFESRKGMDTRIPSLEEARNTPFKNSDPSKIIENRKRMIIGTPERVRDELLELSEVYRTEEFMIINNFYKFEVKANTYALLAGPLI